MDDEDYTYAVVDISKKKKKHTQESTEICCDINMTEIHLDKATSFCEDKESNRIPEIESTTTIYDTIKDTLSSKLSNLIDIKKSANISNCTIGSVVAIVVLSLVIFICVISLSAEINGLKSEISGMQTTLHASISSVADKVMNQSVEQQIAILDLNRFVVEKILAEQRKVSEISDNLNEAIDRNVTLLSSAIQAILNVQNQHENILNSTGSSIMDSIINNRLLNSSFVSLESRIDILELVVDRMSQIRSQITPASSCAALLPTIPSGYYWITDPNGYVVQVYCNMTGRNSLLPASSCAALPSPSPSGYYWVSASNGSTVRVYCDMTRSCGGVTGGWMRVADLDMTNSSHQCPNGLQLFTESNVRACVNPMTAASCSVSIFFDSFNISYDEVCGSIIGYQIGGTNGFKDGQVGIDSFYVDGVSLTYGRPRQHIWTFASARDMFSTTKCPGEASMPPPFVGTDYFCDTGANASDSVTNTAFFSQSPLWDCLDESRNCDSSSPPWFYKQLTQPTTDNIEMRVCRDEASWFENVAIEVIAIYIQ